MANVNQTGQTQLRKNFRGRPENIKRDTEIVQDEWKLLGVRCAFPLEKLKEWT